MVQEIKNILPWAKHEVIIITVTNGLSGIGKYSNGLKIE
jgi:hypothetical protein